MRAEVFPGDIRVLAGSYTPAGWLTCDGSKLNVADQPELFKAIGATYGGDGKTSFVLPNFQAQVPIHAAGGMKVGQVGQGRVKLPPHAAKLRYIIAARHHGWGEAFIGEIRNFAFNFAPERWMRCEGQILPISSFTTLFSLLGDAYGGDWTRTFAVPNLHGTGIGSDGLRCVGMNYCIALEGVYPPRG